MASPSNKMWRFLLSSLAGILSFSHPTSAHAPKYTFVRDGSEAPSVSYYDYIVIGGGTAGCPLAATLSQSSKVLLLERGGSPYGNDNISREATTSSLLCDPSPTSAAQIFVSEDGVTNARARVLGGGTCINGGFYSRASTEYVREAGWDAATVNQSYRWVESVVAHEPRLLQWQSAVLEGLVEAGVTPYNGFTYDHLYGTKIGGSIFDGDGHRHTAADLLQLANPNGIAVLLHATVHRILFRHKGKPRPEAHGVVFRDASGKKHRAYLNAGSKNEIIVSAGALGSPQLLMLSGVGPAEHLRSMGIEVVMDQPMVGQGMADNPLNGVLIPSPLPVEISLLKIAGITRHGSYILTLSGDSFFVCPSTEVEARLRSLGIFPSETFHTQEGSSSFRGGFIVEKVANPLSTGHLELRNKNPDDNPSVTFNYFKEPQDLETCIEGVRMIERVIQSEAFSKFRYPNVSVEDLLNTTQNYLAKVSVSQGNGSRSLEQFCKDTVMTMWHYHGGCQVGRVVGPDYKVLGVDALRVIDGSTFNASPGTNPQATLMMLGRYMGLEIHNARAK